jgi:hypothetical protein
MKTARQRDIDLCTKWSNRDDEKYGNEYKVANEFKDKQVNEGKKIVFDYLKGNSVIPEDKLHDQSYLSQMIMQLLYFRVNIEITEQIFNNWYSNEENEELSDQLYLETANITKQNSIFCESGKFEELLHLIIKQKLLDSYSEEKEIKMIDICYKTISDNLIKAKIFK